MRAPSVIPTPTEAALRERIVRLFGRLPTVGRSRPQYELAFFNELNELAPVESPASNVRLFLDFVAGALPDGDVYLFGGLLRDMALFGRRGFSSDVDLVVEGDWVRLESYLKSAGAKKNKFGGYRLTIGSWPIDIWHARETWAVKNNLVIYQGIASLTETTVLNWDAILMNWRTKSFIYKPNYFRELFNRDLDVVLEENPNPLGTAVRILRHFCQKDAARISYKAAVYFVHCARAFEFGTLKESELKSYGNSLIDPRIYEYFRDLNLRSADIQQYFVARFASLKPSNSAEFW